MSDVPKTHPRYLSLALRDTIVAGVEQRDYLCPWAYRARAWGGFRLPHRGNDTTLRDGGNPRGGGDASSRSTPCHLRQRAMLAALAPDGLIALGRVLNAPLEVNIFHTETGREQRIREHLLKHGASDVLMPTTQAQLSYIDSNRKFVHPDGIFKADVVFVPLEDGGPM